MHVRVGFNLSITTPRAGAEPSVTGKLSVFATRVPADRRQSLGACCGRKLLEIDGEVMKRKRERERLR
jgi:hypothetical protein